MRVGGGPEPREARDLRKLGASVQKAEAERGSGSRPPSQKDRRHLSLRDDLASRALGFEEFSSRAADVRKAYDRRGSGVDNSKLVEDGRLTAARVRNPWYKPISYSPPVLHAKPTEAVPGVKAADPAVPVKSGPEDGVEALGRAAKAAEPPGPRSAAQPAAGEGAAAAGKASARAGKPAAWNPTPAERKRDGEIAASLAAVDIVAANKSGRGGVQRAGLQKVLDRYKKELANPARRASIEETAAELKKGYQRRAAGPGSSAGSRAAARVSGFAKPGGGASSDERPAGVQRPSHQRILRKETVEGRAGPCGPQPLVSGARGVAVAGGGRETNIMALSRPVRAMSRAGNFPVRISLNVSEEQSAELDQLELATGASRGVLAREAVVRGLELLEKHWRQRRYVDPSERSLDGR